MDSELVILHFETPDAAEQAIRTVRVLEAEGFIDIEDAAIMTRDADGWVRAKSADEGSTGRGAAHGGILGLLVGGVLGIPVLGIIAGAGVAAKKSLHADKLEELIFTVGRNMTSGTGVLALSVNSLTDPEIVTERLELHRDKLIRAEVPEALRAQIDEHTR